MHEQITNLIKLLNTKTETLPKTHKAMMVMNALAIFCPEHLSTMWPPFIAEYPRRKNLRYRRYLLLIPTELAALLVL
jgi:hypothetical protein